MQYRIWKYRISLRLWEMDIGDITALSHMHQFFIPVLISILTTLKYSLKPQMKMVFLCMIALFVKC